MTGAQKIAYKESLKTKCKEIIEQRITTLRNGMSAAQSAANSEEKSSAGDKYETSRAMNHLEKNMLATQLSANIRQLESLLSADCNKVYEAAAKGSLVRCGSISFFIATGLGKLIIEDETIFFISPLAPVAISILGKKLGAIIAFNNKKYTIREIF